MPNQPELRKLLSEAILEHSVCECGEYADNFPEHCEHIADVLLSLPGIAITQLPEPDDDHGDGIAFWWQSADVGASNGMVITRFDPGSESLWFEPGLARSIAAALLAAAAAAEADHA